MPRKPFAGDDPAGVLAWLRDRPSIAELSERFPNDWQHVQTELSNAVEQRNFAKLHRLLRPENNVRQRWPFRASLTHSQVQGTVRQRMAALAIEHYSLSAAIGGDKERRRLNWLNAFFAQRLLFERGFTRRPVPQWQFRLVWPLIWQRNRLMPLVGRKGIYCFYSREFVAAVSNLIGARTCHEIGAGDGTLSRFLADAGVTINASDNHSWSDRITYPSEVQRMDAGAALRQHRPQVVICSWPPAGNSFEQGVFQVREVELYIAILSVHEFAAGNWDAYGAQRDFDVAPSPTLASMLLPPELGCQVLLFTRKSKT